VTAAGESEYTPSVAPPLTGKQRRHLRALAHALDPVVQLGKSGLTPGLLEEIDRALEKHELIKVKVGKDSPLGPDESVEPIETGTRSSVAQVIGRILVVYRRRNKDPKIVLPRADASK
jgi:RNA-binding protein